MDVAISLIGSSMKATSTTPPFQRPFAADTETNSTIRVILISARLWDVWLLHWTVSKWRSSRLHMDVIPFDADLMEFDGDVDTVRVRDTFRACGSASWPNPIETVTKAILGTENIDQFHTPTHPQTDTRPSKLQQQEERERKKTVGEIQEK